MSVVFLGLSFAIAAFVYAMAGFGGGSTYNSLLLLGNVNFLLIPIISLTCNLVVVTGGLLYFGRAGFIKPKVVLPFLVSSIPLATIGGALPVKEQGFIVILGSALVISGLILLRPANRKLRISLTSGQRWIWGLPIGAVLGLLSGVTGIGGGIFLAPVMYLANWARPKVIAASASLFIFINSIFGLIGQLSKYTVEGLPDELFAYIALPIVVLISGQIGSFLGSGFFNERLVRSITGVLILLVGSRILINSIA